MTKTATIDKIYVGIDVSKSNLDIYLHPIGKSWTISNESKAIKKFADKHLKAYKDCSIILEATGGYERKCIQVLSSLYKTYRAHPNYVRNFAKALGSNAKTDRIDAKILAQYLLFQENQAGSLHRAIAEDEILKALIMRREQLKEMLHSENCRAQSCADKNILKSYQRMLKELTIHIKQIEERIEQQIASSEVYSIRKELLLSFKGIGSNTAAMLIAFIPELGLFNKQQIAALVGVAPYNRDSGQKIGKRSIAAGRKVVRNMLYMAAMVAIRFNHKMKEFYERLVKKSKTHKMAIVAVMRKMIVIVNTMIKLKQKWKFA